MRLIDADAFTKWVQWRGSIWPILSVERVFNTIKDAPTIDAVPVVRCKDCRHRPSGDGANHHIEFPDDVCPCQCDDYWYSWMPKDDWYCANAERRENG